MNVKPIFISAVFLVIAVQVAYGQQSERGLRLGAVAGGKYNSFSNGLPIDIDPDMYSFTLGAGATYLTKRFLFGGEFYQSSGNKKTSAQSLQYIGSVTSVFVGCNLLPTGPSRLETSVGFGLSRNQLIAEGEANVSFVNIYNNQLSINPSLSYYYLLPNDLHFGIKVGYSVGVNGVTVWKYKSTDDSAASEGGIDALMLQVSIGGVVDFNKSQR